MTPTPGGISEAEYRELPRRFNPSKFDANHLIDLAKAAGQQYMVFTTKHHDGFCMTEGQLQIDLPQHPPDSNVTVVAVRTL
jgi:alpha-L-fucosidase